MNMHIPSIEVADANHEVVGDDVRLDRMLIITDATGKSLDTMEAQTRGMDAQTFHKWADQQMALCDQTNNTDARLVELQAAIREANVAYGDTNVAYYDAHVDARQQAEARGEPVPVLTRIPNQDHINALPYDIAWGLLDMRKAAEQTKAHCNALLQEVSETPANTIHGIWAKLEIWHLTNMSMKDNERPLDEFSAYEQRMAVAALRDARRLVTAQSSKNN